MKERERQSGVGRGGGVFNTIDLLEKGILIYFFLKKKIQCAKSTCN